MREAKQIEAHARKILTKGGLRTKIVMIVDMVENYQGEDHGPSAAGLKNWEKQVPDSRYGTAHILLTTNQADNAGIARPRSICGKKK